MLTFGLRVSMFWMLCSGTDSPQRYLAVLLQRWATNRGLVQPSFPLSRHFVHRSPQRM